MSERQDKKLRQAYGRTTRKLAQEQVDKIIKKALSLYKVKYRANIFLGLSGWAVAVYLYFWVV